jgi:ectoine hydroxylase-related dioxygenase (phytanoyl-CoA dioxygenase family)
MRVQDEMAGTISTYGVTQRTPHADRTDQALEELALVGYTVVDGGYDETALAGLSAAFDGALAGLHERFGGEALAAIDEQHTLRAMLSLDRAFLDVARNARVMDVCRRAIGDYVILNQQNGIINPPNAQRYNQAAFHRDLPFQHFVSSRPLAINALFCLDDFTADNGATWVIPASHKQDAFPGDATVAALQAQITAPRGSYLLLDGLLYHRGGVNRTALPRRAVNHLYSVPILRPQIDLAAILGEDFTTDPELRRLLGYEVRIPGSVEAYYAKRRVQLGVAAPPATAPGSKGRE